MRKFLLDKLSALQKAAGTAYDVTGPYVNSALALGTQIPLAREAMRTKPVKQSAGESLQKLAEAADKRVISLGGKTLQDRTTPFAVVPKGDDLERFKQTMLNPTEYAGIELNRYPTVPTRYAITYNPNASSETLAHELGHAVSDNTGIGSKISRARSFIDNNKGLSTALGMAAIIAPGAYSALKVGDDDLDEAAVIGALLASPTIIDEALASKNALAIMKDAGMPANLGQRARLAGGLATYLGAPLVSAGLGNLIGNQFDYNSIAEMRADSDTTVYEI